MNHHPPIPTLYSAVRVANSCWLMVGSRINILIAYAMVVVVSASDAKTSKNSALVLSGDRKNIDDDDG